MVSQMDDIDIHLGFQQMAVPNTVRFTIIMSAWLMFLKWMTDVTIPNAGKQSMQNFWTCLFWLRLPIYTEILSH